MTALLTQCPHCQTSFRVSSAQLKAAKGLVRCGSCLGVFSAPSNEIRIKPPEGYVIEELAREDEDTAETDIHEEIAPEPASSPSATVTEDTPLPQALPANVPDEPEEFTDTFDDHVLEHFAAVDESDEDWQQDLPAHLQEEQQDRLDEELEEELDEEFTDDSGSELHELPTGEPHTTPDDEPLDDISSEQAEPLAAGCDDPRDDILSSDDFEHSFGDLNLDELYDDADESHTDVIDTDETLYAAHDAAPALEEASVSDNEDEDEDDYLDDEPAPEPLIAEPLIAEPLRAERTSFPRDKRDIHSSLSALRDEDELAPVTDEELDGLDDEPVTLVQGSNLRNRVTTALLLVANVLLLLALPLPWLYVHRNELPTHPRYAFMAPIVCRYLGCETPAAPAAATPTLKSMYTQQLLVRSHPREANALEVSFVFHNDAAEAQPFPALELAFSDPASKLMANRLFQPDEYLPPELRHLPTMPAQSTVQVQLELVDPGSNAVNYKVVLHPR